MRQNLLLFILIIFFLHSPVFSAAQTLAKQTRVLVLGNTADIPSGSSFFFRFREFLAASDQPIQLILSGDLINGCQNGQPVDDNLNDLFQALSGLEKVEATIVPGDRDWDRSGSGGYDCALALEALVKEKGAENIHWSIDDACPGPEVKELAPDIVLITLNTQWWNHPYRKPEAADAICDFITPDVILEEIRDAIEENLDKYVLVAGHFPPISLGKYGGRFPLSAHLFPPIIGSFQVSYRQNIGSSMDLSNEKFDFFSRQLQEIAGEYEGLVFISGHDANQQIINYRGNYLINSGAPVKGDYALPTKRAAVTSKKPGFLEAVYQNDGKARYIFHHWTGNGFEALEQGQLYQSPCLPVLDTAIFISPADHCLDDTTNFISKLELESDSVVVSAGDQYAAGKLKQLIFGAHYRTSWTEPVQIPYLRMDTVFGGLRPRKLGGGRQTVSLKLQAADGREYAFRSVDKDPSKAFPILLRNTVITEVTRDQTSSQHPYGALAVAPMLDQLDILHASPRLYVMPPDPRLGPFQATFNGMLGMLEERPRSSKPGVPAFGDADFIYKSHEMFREMLAKPGLKLKTNEFARARLFDILAGDWSKHEDNWKWAGYQTGDHIAVRPIPRDRDHVFSNLDGILPWLADREWAVPNLENFGYKIKSIRSLTFQARHMDRFLANSLSRQDWLDAAEYIQKELSDEDIRRAIRAIPASIYPVSGSTIEQKLIQRKKALQTYARDFYQELAKYVDVVGTNREERFLITRRTDGATLVEVYAKESNELLYERTFFPEETREIRLYGLHGKDRFELEGQVDQAIKARIIGGPGEDEIIDRSAVKKGGKRTLVYEKDPDAKLEAGAETRQINHWKEELYYYDRNAFEYNSYLPLAYLGFSSFNGFSLGGGLNFTSRSFNKRDFSSKHKITGSLSTLGNYMLSYEGLWHELIQKWDVQTSLDWGRPVIYNFFFGLGSQTIKDQDLFNQDYYRFFINAFHAAGGLRRSFLRQSFFSLDLGLEKNHAVNTENTILEDHPEIYGAQEELNIVTVRAAAELDFRDHKNFPRRGVRLAASQEFGFVGGRDYSVSDLMAEFFITPHRLPVTLGFQAGLSTSYGQIPFYKKPRLGMTDGLRGYQRNRFTGDQRLYWNSELRVPLGSIRTPIVPFKLGLRGFYDRGQISDKGEVNAPWRSAYGGGIYLIPVTRAYTLSVFASFSEEESGLIGFQLGTNF